MVVFHVSTFILHLHTAGGYDYILWQKAPLTNLVMVTDAVTLTFQIIVTGKPLIEEGRHVTGFFVVRLSH